MRRRSERKKSVDPSSVTTTTSRRSSRRTSRKTPDVEKNEDTEQQQNETPTKTDSSPNRASSEERIESNKRGRSTRGARTPAKRQLRNISVSDNKIDAITEEENGLVTSVAEKVDNLDDDAKEQVQQETQNEIETNTQIAVNVDNVEESTEINENAQSSKIVEEEEEKEEITTNVTEAYMAEEDVEMKSANVSENKSYYNEEQNITEVLSVETQQAQKETSTDEALKPKEATPEPKEVVEKQEVDIANGQQENTETEQALNEKVEHTKKLRILSNHNTVVSNESNTNRTRKRKWLSKKTIENKEPILSISTDSLKNLISDVQPVPLSDVKLESSSEVEEVPSEHNAREISSSPSDHERTRNSIDKVIPEKLKVETEAAATSTTVSVTRTGLPLQSSPSPPRNQTTNVLYITNLVRPFTVMQLKGLLARTGKIVENGFWIDRIKSKCYVQYETQDEAIETRHALHGVRWPVSNPKCLNVDFGKLADMERAIKLSNDDVPKQEKETKENYVSSGNTWTREQRDDDERKDTKPIREWDVGKRDSRDKREAEKQRSPKENTDKEDKFKKGRVRDRENRKDRSASPVRKVKKEEPPLRLLDDLFRKTKATPCIYWLPLTPEQIAEKEAYRQKRIEERKERIKQRELEREKEQELERERERERNRSRERDRSRDRSRSHDRSRERRRRSSDRRRSRSRDRRRY